MRMKKTSASAMTVISRSCCSAERDAAPKDALYMDGLRPAADEIAAENGAVIFWDDALIEARIDTL